MSPPPSSDWTLTGHNWVKFKVYIMKQRNMKQSFSYIYILLQYFKAPYTLPSFAGPDLSHWDSDRKTIAFKLKQLILTNN